MTDYKVTKEMISEEVIKEEYVILPDGKTTICILTLKNGFTVRGESSCVDPSNFKKAEGEKYSRQAAIEKIWPLLGFRMQDKWHEEIQSTFVERLVIERDELALRFLKLGQFLESAAFHELPPVDQEDMRDQFNAMQVYFDALDRRTTRLLSQV